MISVRLGLGQVLVIAERKIRLACLSPGAMARITVDECDHEMMLGTWFVMEGFRLGLYKVDLDKIYFDLRMEAVRIET